MADIKKQNNHLKYDYKLIFLDNAFESKKTISNLHRLKSVDKANALMSFWGTAGTVFEGEHFFTEDSGRSEWQEHFFKETGLSPVLAP